MTVLLGCAAFLGCQSSQLNGAGGDGSAAAGDASTADLISNGGNVDLAAHVDLAKLPDLVAVPDLTTVECESDSDCRLFESYCKTETSGPCACLPVASKAPDPMCTGNKVTCFAPPCAGKDSVCDTKTHTCAVH